MKINGRMSRNEFETICRAATKTAYLGDSRALCQVLGGLKMFVDTRDISLAPHLMLDGFWEAWISLAMLRVLRPGMRVADIGANCGYYTLLMAQQVGERGHVYAFEPNPRMLDLVSLSTGISGFSTVCELIGRAAHSTTGRAMIFEVPEGRPMNARISGDSPQLAQVGHVSVTSTTVDDLNLGKMDFVKIDVEGAEREVWRGMERTLEQNPDIQLFIEFNPLRLEFYDPREFLEQIKRCDFKLALVNYQGDFTDATTESIIDGGEEVTLYLKRA